MYYEYKRKFLKFTHFFIEIPFFNFTDNPWQHWTGKSSVHSGKALISYRYQLHLGKKHSLYNLSLLTKHLFVTRRKHTN